MSAERPDRPDPTLADKAYVADRAQRCRALPPQLRHIDWPSQPRRPDEPQRWCDYFRDWKDPHPLSGLPAVPLDNWSPKVAELREFEATLDGYVDELERKWLEAAE